MKKNGAVYIYSTIEYYSLYIHRHFRGISIFTIHEYKVYRKKYYMQMLGIYRIDLWTYTIPKMHHPNRPGGKKSKPPRRMTKLSNFSLRSRGCPLPPAEEHAAAWIRQWHSPSDVLAIWTHDLTEITVASMTSNFSWKVSSKTKLCMQV